MNRLLIQIISVLVFFLLWKAYVSGFDVSPLVLPPPEDVVHALVRLMQRDDTYYHIYTTLAECLGGFCIAVIVGTLLGQLLGRIAILDTIFKPFVIALQLTPKVALIPLFILWFGFGIESKIIISALLAFFPVFSNSYLGAKSVDTGLIEVFQVGKASTWQRFKLLVIPASLPYILMGMEMAIVLAIGLYLAMVGPNAAQRMEKMKYRAVSVLVFSVLMVWCVLTFSQVSTFLYFNF